MQGASLLALLLTVMSMTAVDARRHPNIQEPSSTVGDAAHVRVVHGAHFGTWIRQHRADPLQTVTLKLVLTPAKSDKELSELVNSVSNVNSPEYGKFLSHDELHTHWKPSELTEDAVRLFIAEHGRHVTATHSIARDIMTLRLNVATAERVFRTSLYEYAHKESDHTTVIRPLHEFAIPSPLASHVVFIDGLEAFPTPRQAQFMVDRRIPGSTTQEYDPHASSSNFVKTRPFLTTPAVIRAQYGIPSPQKLNGTHPDNKLIVGSFLNEYYTENDLTTFLTQYEEEPIAFPAHTGHCLVGSSPDYTMATGEASLDVQTTASIARSENIEMLCYQTYREPSRPFSDDNQEPFLLFMEHVNAMTPRPAVVSLSYTDEECAIPSNYAVAVNRALMKAAMQGISVVISAGDAGVQGGHISNFCGTSVCSRFRAMFPASSPYVTSVGATSLDVEQAPVSTEEGRTRYPEIVTSVTHGALITSGGGFSETFEAPTYQTEAVASYLAYAVNETEPHNLSSLFNPNGRAYPDVTALGHSFPVIQNGEMLATDGTSLSAPIFASMIVLLNKLRLEAGKPVLGFLNPLLYQLASVCPQMFHDITQGSTNCGSSTTSCCLQGHRAISGWDATSGLGSLNFTAMAEDLDQCMAQIQTPSLNQIQLLQQIDPTGLGNNSTMARIEQVFSVLMMVAIVVLFSVLVAVRSQLFPGRPYLEQLARAQEPAREQLLGRGRQT